MAWKKGVSRREYNQSKIKVTAEDVRGFVKDQEEASAALSRAMSQPPKGKKTWAAMKAGNNWDGGIADAEESPDEFNISRDKFPEGMDLQWWTAEIYGQPMKQRMATAARGGWTQVHDTDFDNWHHRVLGARYGLDDGGFIVHKGTALHARPQEISDRSKAREIRKARDVIATREQAFKGGDIGATGANHPSALATNKISRSIERIDIPKE